MNAARLTITVSLTRAGSFVVHPEPAVSADLALNIERTFTDQPAAEHYADGVAAGLRACGRTVDISIDVPESEDQGPLNLSDDPEHTIEDDLGFADLDRMAMDRGIPCIPSPEADPVARRLARDAEAGHYRAAALGM